MENSRYFVGVYIPPKSHRDKERTCVVMMKATLVDDTNFIEVMECPAGLRQSVIVECMAKPRVSIEGGEFLIELEGGEP